MKSSNQSGALALGLSEREKFDDEAKLRAETSEASQRPKSTTKSVASDRGTFKSKC